MKFKIKKKIEMVFFNEWYLFFVRNKFFIFFYYGYFLELEEFLLFYINVVFYYFLFSFLIIMGFRVEICCLVLMLMMIKYIVRINIGI